MKKNAALLMLFALLICSLAGCGRDQSPNAPSAPETRQEGPVERFAQDAGQAARDAGHAAGELLDPVTPDASAASRKDSHRFGASYGQMKENARVHDRDGDLHDHENAVTPGWSHLP